ncbi:MAG: pyridoxamine 5'-phosphate oxidase family protein [Gammaproteobacteria bacterium]|nr:pyridoxamine 5'-phosphate oxidase family protein [Gammaproteobacteria bacterium]
MKPTADTAIFHDGEHELQLRAGSRKHLAAMESQLIRNYMPEQHRAFFAQLPFVIAGSVDRGGQPWASLLCNPPGFITSPDPRHLAIAALPMAADPLLQTLACGAGIALLGIEQHTRRRNRLNGVVAQLNPGGFEVEAKQSFGNCPKYIQARTAEYWERGAVLSSDGTTALTQATRRIIESADTFFIASAHPDANKSRIASNGIDVSHRGGKPGFVKIDREDALLIPDFSGNRFFNTLGNLILNPRAGLLFVDFETGDLLYIATTTEIIFDGPELNAFVGAERLLRLRVNYVRHVTAAAPLRWQGAVQTSPFLEQTGNWGELDSSA